MDATRLCRSAQITEDHLGVAQLVRAGYRDLGLNHADPVKVALASDYGSGAELTLDRRDSRAVRPLGWHIAFGVLPDHLPISFGWCLAVSSFDSVVRDARMTLAALTDSLVGAGDLP